MLYRTFHGILDQLFRPPIIVLIIIHYSIPDRYKTLAEAPRPDFGCEFVADIAFLIDSSNSIRLEYLNQLQFVQFITARYVGVILTKLIWKCIFVVRNLSF